MCSISLLNPNPYFHLDYIPYNMDCTNDMWETADRVSWLIYAIPLAFVATAEVITNGLFLLYNAPAFVINTMSSLVYRICLAVSDSFAPVVVIPTIFLNADLATLKLALRSTAIREENPVNQNQPIVAYLVDQQCAIWYDLDRDVVCIQDRHRDGQPTLAMKMNDLGQVLSLQVDGAARDSFPENFQPYMWTCMQEALKASSEYTEDWDQIRIRVVKEGLKQIPEFHLEKLAGKLALLHHIGGLKVKFLEFNLQNGQEIDAGGPSRDLMDDLWDGLLNGNTQVLTFSRQNGLEEALPKATAPAGEDGIPGTWQAEKDLLQNMGIVMMNCGLTGEQISIGRRFEEGLFKAIFSLTVAEVDAHNLPFPVQLKMMKAILENRGIQIDGNHPVKNLENWLLGNIDWGHARQVAEWAAAEVPDEDVFDEQNVNDQQTVINGLKKYLYDLCGSALAPMHQIAKGMKRMRENVGQHWGGINWKDFSDKVQGSLDRNFISQRLEISPECNQEIRKKVGWLREWILDPQTPNQQIQDFLKFLSGSSTLPRDGRIKIQPQQGEPGDYLPMPKAHTCFNSIELSPVPVNWAGAGRVWSDNTKENFINTIENLKNFEYQMG